MSLHDAGPSVTDFVNRSPEWSEFRVACALDELRAINNRDTALLRIDRVLGELADELGHLRLREEANFRRLRAPTFASEYRSITYPRSGLESSAPITRLGVTPDGSIVIADAASQLSIWQVNGPQSWVLCELCRGERGPVVFDVDPIRGLVVALDRDNIGLLRKIHPGVWEYVSLHGLGSEITKIEVLNDGRIAVMCCDGLTLLRESSPTKWAATAVPAYPRTLSFEVLPSGWIVLGEVPGPSVVHESRRGVDAGRCPLGPVTSEAYHGTVMATRALSDGGVVVGRSTGRLSVFSLYQEELWREQVLSHSGDAVVELQSLPEGGFFLVRASGALSVWMPEGAKQGREGFFQFGRSSGPLGWRERMLFSPGELKDTVLSKDVSISSGRMLADGRIVLGGQVSQEGRVVVLRGVGSKDP